jgi:DNA polymerase III subunit alpha
MINNLLGVRTDFSLGESLIGVSNVVEAASQAGTKFVGVCDTMSISSLIELTKTCAKNDLHLVSGVRVRVIMAAEKEEEACYLKLFPTNEEGVRSLYRLLSRGFQSDRFYYVARVTWDDLAELLSDDSLIITTGDLQSVTQRDDMLAALVDLKSKIRFSASFYELAPCTSPYWSRQNYRAMTWGELHSFKPIVIMPSFWMGDDVEAFSVNAGIADKRPYVDYLRPASNYKPLTLAEFSKAAVAAAAEIENRYGKNVKAVFLDGLKQTSTFPDLCSYRWSKQEASLPVLNLDPDSEILRLCKVGWSERFKTHIFNHMPTQSALTTDYLPRLQFELAAIRNAGFSQYFLLVADMVKWAKSKGIYVGPGRGSIGGSLVAYLMGITDVDPIRFQLLFERFINPDRLDLPDADLDFMSARREEVVEYLVDTYGPDYVAGIVNYNTMGARSAIRDVGRIYGLNGEQMGATKYIGGTHGVSLDLTGALEATPEIQQFAEQHASVWNNAVKVEGKMRAYGTHAAGIVVAGVKLIERSVIERRGDSRVINWDKRVSEDQGLIKLDILGLTTLDMFDHAIKLILERHGVSLDINSIDLEDAETLELFNQAKTAGVFQFEGGSVRRLLKEMAESAPLNFEDLVALNALNRPGPIDAGLCSSYIKRRAGSEAVNFPHPTLIPVLKDTYGVIVYQEQVMQASRALCGFTPGEADTLRKAMGKKDPVMMAAQRDKFVDGAESVSGMDRTKADILFTQIEGFAGYAFNKSHALSYTLIAFQAAYLKAHHMVDFYTASMTIADGDKLAAIVKQALSDGIHVIPPDVNISTDRFKPLSDSVIAAPLSAVLTVSDKGAQAIMKARLEPTFVEITTGRGKNKSVTTETHGPGKFLSMDDFQLRVPARLVNARSIANLDRVGAFARVASGQAPSTHISRQRDQIELMPSISDQGVRADRPVMNGTLTIDAVADNHIEAMDTLDNPNAVDPFLGANARMLIVLDAPFNDDCELKRQYSYQSFVEPALHDAGLTADDCMFSWVVRRPKAKGEREMPAAEIAKSIPYLMKDIEIAKPPVIVLLGPVAIKSFFPEIKGIADHIGRKSFSASLDATLIIGFNPTQIWHDADKKNVLQNVFEEAKKLTEDIS